RGRGALGRGGGGAGGRGRAQRATGGACGQCDGGGRAGGDRDCGGQRNGPLAGTDGGGRSGLRGPHRETGAGGELVDGELQARGGQRQREPLQRDDLEDGVRDLDDVERQSE